MRTIIIYRKSSQKFIDQYRALFEPYLANGKVSFCFWNESGLDIDSALHELSGLVRGEKIWRAIVALPMDDERNGGKQEEPYREQNPFDFVCNANPEPAVEESPIPLIRVAQMLGGVPLVNRHYINQMDEADSLSARMTVRRLEDDNSLEAQQKIWEDLNDKYSVDFDRPSQLLLFTARMPKEIEIPKDTDTDIMNRHESDSSMFWYRNRYPAKSRFLVQDCSRPGNAHYMEDLFSFWMTVFTLALNDMPTGTFEAYKLYHVKAKLEKEKIREVFSAYYDRLFDTQYTANLQIAELRKSAQLRREQDELPNYSTEIPVKFNLSEHKNLHVPEHRIGLVGDIPVHEEPWWHQAVEQSRRGLEKLFRSLQINLDRASIAARYASKLNRDEVQDLDEYQYQDMDLQLAEMEKELLVFSTYSVLPFKAYRRGLKKQEEGTAVEMRKRMTAKLALGAFGIAILIYLFSFLPDLVYQIQYGEDFFPIAALAGGGIIFLILTTLVVLLFYRKVIKDRIIDFNRMIRSILDNLVHAEQSYSSYLSKCSTYMRGRKLLQLLLSKKEHSAAGIISLMEHVDQLEVQKKVIEGWLADFNVTVLDTARQRDKVDFRFDIPPARNRDYLIQLDRFDLNISMTGGSPCQAPYPFVTDFSIKREAVFEPVDGNEEEEE